MDEFQKKGIGLDSSQRLSREEVYDRDAASRH